jgi:hypothetical protein
MNRRDFLRLKTERGVLTVEISCQRLHMSCLESRVTSGGLDQNYDPTVDGEPPTAFEKPTTRQLFENLRRDADGVDILRIVEHRWLSEGDEELQREFEALLSWVRDRGGRVEFG